MTKLKAFADDKINVKQKSEFDSERVENIVRKGENAATLSQSFRNTLSCGSLKPMVKW